jgi:uncharacterized membrane protein
MIEHTDAGMQGPVAAPSIIFGTIAATIHGPAGGPWEAVHPAPPPANGNGAALNLDDIPDLSLGEDWHDDGRSQDYVEPDPISAEAYFDLTDEELREVPLDARGLPFGFWNWALEDQGKYNREHPRTPNAGPPRERLEVNSGGFSRNRTQQGEQKAPSRVIGAGTFMRSYVAISYTLGGILPSGYLYGLTAKQGSGKTALMIAAALAVAFGRDDILGCAVERGRVAYVTIENPVDFKMKLAVNCFVHNISYDEIESRVAVIDGRDTPEQIFDGLRLDAEATGDFQLVCFDTFQAGFAAANAGAFNENEAVLGYLIRLRPLTTLPGSPSGLVAFHPTKNAGETELIPYGGGSTYNEVDGNLTLWKEAAIKLHHNRLRGPEFEPHYFRIEKLSCPEIVDKSGREILLPVLRPATAIDVEERAAAENKNDIALLRALLANPGASQRELADATGIPKSTVDRTIKKLERAKMLELGLNGLVVSERAKKQLNSIG